MDARALICDERQDFTLSDVILPDPGPDHILVRARYTGVSIGTEFALIRGRLSWGPYPICTGYQGVGVIERVGENVAGFKVSEVVYYRDNKSIRLPDGRAVSPTAGTHCSHAVIDPQNTHGVALLPEGVDQDVASLFVMPAVGLNGVDMANPRMGETVLVHGAGLIGLGVVAACSHRGCVVVAADLDAGRLDVARKLGADHVINALEQDVEEELARIAPSGADAVFEATGVPECVDTAIALCKQKGTFVWQGNYGEAPISLRFLAAHARRLIMRFPCDDGLAPSRRAVLKNIAMGALRWDQTITHRVGAEDAPAFYDAINKGQANDVLGAVIRWA